MDKVINLKPDTKDEDIIAQKGNKKCIFYSDDVCRNGDRTRDCINCARVEYRNLYSLNWDNQEKLHSELQRAKAENFELKESLKCFQTPEAIKALTFYKTGEFELQEKKCIKLEQENERLKKLKCKFKEYCTCNTEKYHQILQEIREIVSEQCQQCFVIDGFTKPDDCGICDYKRILDKINEVIGVEEDVGNP